MAKNGKGRNWRKGSRRCGAGRAAGVAHGRVQSHMSMLKAVVEYREGEPPPRSPVQVGAS